MLESSANADVATCFIGNWNGHAFPSDSLHDIAEPQATTANLHKMTDNDITHTVETESNKTKRFRLSKDAAQILLDFYFDVTTHPSVAQCKWLVDKIHLTTSGNECYNAASVKRWFMFRHGYEKTKTKHATDSPSQILKCQKRTKPSRKVLRASQRTHLAALCAEVSCQSAKNLTGTWASIMNCDASLVREWVGNYYGTPPTGLPTPEPEPPNALPIALDMPPSPKSAASAFSLSSNATVTPVDRNSLSWSSHAPVSQEDPLCDIAKGMDAAEADLVSARSMSRNEFDERMEPIMSRMNAILQRIG